VFGQEILLLDMPKKKKMEIILEGGPFHGERINWIEDDRGIIRIPIIPPPTVHLESIVAPKIIEWIEATYQRDLKRKNIFIFQ
jgi:hypothetical protein